MNIISFISLYLFVGTIAFLFAVDALNLKDLRKKRGTKEAAEHVKSILNENRTLKVEVAYILVLMFLPAMFLAEFFYDWE